MKNLILLLIIALAISGCATPGLGTKEFRESLINKKAFPKDTLTDFVAGKIKLGMTKEQVLWIKGSPANWTKYPTSEGIFESWYYHTSCDTYDFKDGKLIGYSWRGRYHDIGGIEDVRDYLEDK